MGIYCIFGKPGSGKTTSHARIVKEFHSNKPNFITGRKYTALYCTDPSIKGCIPISYSDLGTFEPPMHSAFILSEAGVGLNNRNWKKLPLTAIDFFAKHRHREVDIFLDSQTLDIDITVRMRTACDYIAKKVGPFTLLIPVSFNLDVDKDTKQFMECYERPCGIQLILSLLKRETKFFLRRSYYKYFDTYEWSREWEKCAPVVYNPLPKGVKSKMC